MRARCSSLYRHSLTGRFASLKEIPLRGSKAGTTRQVARRLLRLALRRRAACFRKLRYLSSF